jgi:beta-1,4-N-acetylgalactosaminyltransferase 2
MSRAERVKRIMMGPYGAPLRLAHAATVRAQLALVTGVDRVRYRRREDPAWLADQVTVAAKTFLRPATAARMVRSMRRAFPGHIVIADDSTEPMRPPDDRTEIVAMPFNSGVPRGRNAALARVRTPYVLVTDDDAFFTRGCGLDGAVRFLEEHPEVDGVCALLVELPRWYSVGYGDEGELLPGHLPPRLPFGEVVGGLPVVPKGPQIYVARTEALRGVPYDENIRMVDHRDFFSSASGRLVFVHDPHFVAFHARTPFDRTYTSYREDVAADLFYLAQKWQG